MSGAVGKLARSSADYGVVLDGAATPRPRVGRKTLFGRKYMGILRTTFVIDPSGKVSKVFEKVKPEEHGEEVAKFLAVEKART